MKKFLLKLLLVSLMLSFSSIVLAENVASPVNVLQNLADKMIANLKAKKASLAKNPSLVYSLAYKIIVPHADLNEMSKRVLPPQTWNQATPAQREQFKNEFTTLLVRTYASALADYTDQKIQFYPVRGGYQGRTYVRVDSQIVRSDGPSISIYYLLVRSGNEWKLYDMSVEGVSLLESFRSQFADKLAEYDMPGLINFLRQHNSK